MNDQFALLDNLKAKLKDECKDKVAAKIDQFGYIEPWHGLRGKQRWLDSDEDLEEMYVKFRGKEITLWCFGKDETPINDHTHLIRKTSLKSTSIWSL